MKLKDAKEINVVRSEKKKLWNFQTQMKQTSYVQKNYENCRRKRNESRTSRKTMKLLDANETCRTSRKTTKLVDANETNAVLSEKLWNL
jgi:hypothetical protein